MGYATRIGFSRLILLKYFFIIMKWNDWLRDLTTPKILIILEDDKFFTIMSLWLANSFIWWVLSIVCDWCRLLLPSSYLIVSFHSISWNSSRPRVFLHCCICANVFYLNCFIFFLFQGPFERPNQLISYRLCKDFA